MKISTYFFIFVFYFTIPSYAEIQKTKQWYIKGYVEALKDSNADVRRSAVSKIGQLGDSAKEYISEIAKLLKDQNSIVRANTVFTLGQMGDSAKEYISEIAKLLKDQDSIVRSNSIFVLGQMGDSANKYIPEIVKFLKYENLDVRGIKKQYTLEILLSILNDEIEQQQYTPEINISILNGEMRRVLKEQESTPKSLNSVRDSVKEDLFERYKINVNEVEKILIHNSAIYALAKIGSSAKEYIPEIAKLLKDEDTKVRYSAIDALAKSGSIAKEYIPEIAKLLTDKSTSIYKIKKLIFFTSLQPTLFHS